MPCARQVLACNLHKPTGYTRVRIDGRDPCLGCYGTPESRAEYARLIAETFRPGTAPPPAATPNGTCPDLSINELLVRYLKHPDSYYVRDGTPTGEAADLRDAVRPLREF